MIPNPLSGWWFQPLWKILVKWDDSSQYIEKEKMVETTNQIIMVSLIPPWCPLYTEHRPCISAFARATGSRPCRAVLAGRRRRHKPRRRATTGCRRRRGDHLGPQKIVKVGETKKKCGCLWFFYPTYDGHHNIHTIYIYMFPYLADLFKRLNLLDFFAWSPYETAFLMVKLSFAHIVWWLISPHPQAFIPIICSLLRVGLDSTSHINSPCLLLNSPFSHMFDG
jgi:hypothetical protein